jgi:tungstate transport system ATP-binding protein
MKLSLEVSNIGKSYNGNRVLENCSFSFHDDGIYVLTGSNGCGKSTFFRICSLIESPDSGEINYFSNRTVLPKDLCLKRRITLLLPRIGVFNTTVFKNIAYGLTIRGIKHAEAEEKIIKVLEFVQLSHKKNQNALTLSSGETQRLGIARALVIEPEILFLDEPTASIDRKNVEIIEDIILNMKNYHKATVVMTTHNMEQAERLADSLLLIQDGKIVEETQ